MDALQKRYCIASEKRIELFGEILEKIRKEIDDRDFSKINTIKLLQLLENYSNLIKQEEIPITFKEKKLEAESLELDFFSVEEWSA